MFGAAYGGGYAGQGMAGQGQATDITNQLYGSMMNMMTNMSAMNTMGTMLAMNTMAASGQPTASSYGGGSTYSRKSKGSSYATSGIGYTQPFELIQDPLKAKIERLMAEAPIPLPSNANWVGLIHEFHKKNTKKVEEPELVCLREHGRPHERRYCYRMTVKVDGEALSAIATATTKKKAKQEAGKRLAHLIGKDQIFDKEEKSKKKKRQFDDAFPIMAKMPEMPKIEKFPLLPKMPELPTLTKEDCGAALARGPPSGPPGAGGGPGGEREFYLPPGYTGPPCPPPPGHPAWSYPPFCFGPPPPGHPAWKIPPWCNWDFGPDGRFKKKRKKNKKKKKKKAKTEDEAKPEDEEKTEEVKAEVEEEEAEEPEKEETTDTATTSAL